RRRARALARGGDRRRRRPPLLCGGRGGTARGSGGTAPHGGGGAPADRAALRLDADRRGVRGGARATERRTVTALAALLGLLAAWLAIWSYLLYSAWIRRLAARRPKPLAAPPRAGPPSVEVLVSAA